jgi:hypothetical protein
MRANCKGVIIIKVSRTNAKNGRGVWFISRPGLQCLAVEEEDGAGAGEAGRVLSGADGDEDVTGEAIHT